MSVGGSTGDHGVSVEGSVEVQWGVSRVSVRGSLRGSLGGHLGAQ